MERLNKSTKQQLWKDMDYLDGRKVFGELETFVQTTTETDHIPISDAPSALSIIMPTTERPDKTIETMDSLDIAAKNAGISTEIVLVDNSFTPHLHANELEKYMGYVIHPEGLAFHKEGSDGVSMGHDIPQRISENLKSLCMLFYRNRVFPGSSREEQHDLLVSFNTDAVAKLMRTDRDSASEIVNNLEILAQAIDDIDNPDTFNDFVNDFCPHTNELVRPYVTDLGARISHHEVYGRIKQLHMLNVSTRSYRLSM